MIRPEFQHRTLTEAGVAGTNVVAAAISEALDKIEAVLPAGRERAVVITKLQEAAFFANRGVALANATDR